jgi:hypothetical protein
MNDIRDAWPMVARLMARLAALGDTWPPLCTFSNQCLRGDPDSNTLFLVYDHEMTESGNPSYGEEWAAFLERLNSKPMPATRVARDGPRAILRTFGEHGLRLHLRFDRGPARRCFPMLSVCDFGESQISLMTVEGPPTQSFRDLENAIWGIIYDEATRFERAAAQSSDAARP